MEEKAYNIWQAYVNYTDEKMNGFKPCESMLETSAGVSNADNDTMTLKG